MARARSKSSPTGAKRTATPEIPAPSETPLSPTPETKTGSAEPPIARPAVVAAKDDPRNALRSEIRTLRKLVQDKSAQLRSLDGGAKTGGASVVVTKAVALLLRQEGATKDVLVSETGAKKGYVDALLNRILPERGYSITATPIEGSRQKSYRIQQPPTSA